MMLLSLIQVSIAEIDAGAVGVIRYHVSIRFACGGHVYSYPAFATYYVNRPPPLLIARNPHKPTKAVSEHLIPRQLRDIIHIHVFACTMGLNAFRDWLYTNQICTRIVALSRRGHVTNNRHEEMVLPKSSSRCHLISNYTSNAGRNECHARDYGISV